MIGAAEDELVVTSGATESNNLALFGVMLHPRQKRRKIISVVTEHKAILDPLNRLKSMGFDVQLIDVSDQNSNQPGQVDLWISCERTSMVKPHWSVLCGPTTRLE